MVPQGLAPVLVICGPTASGKSRLAVSLARRLSSEIISADSRKIYRRMDIGTAKPTGAQRVGVVFHMLDICEPGETYDAARFAECAAKHICELHRRGLVPIVCGGSGLYIRALLNGIIDTPARDESLRAQLQEQESRSPGCLHERLRRSDPASAVRMPPGDVLRIVRALEVLELTGRPISEIQAEQARMPPRYRALQVAPDWPRSALRTRIEQRVERMLAEGWLDEVRALQAEGARRALACSGYRQLDAYLKGSCRLDEAVTGVKLSHWHYARHQMKWFRAAAEVRWLHAQPDEDSLAAEVDAFMSAG
ncbi:MAG: tRNA (adenosine(37)-N6)-dimethylallyltransferase MiaA [Deltaproteobacteria bacterium]|nr:tRNA (adenosine(37)-N6)-dimethylallyltransferase MiaA [Deltaproteobacteria bacterium]